jgi:hypothetical protein
VLSLGHSELVYRQPVIVVRSVEVDYARLRSSDGAVVAAVLDGDAVDQHAMRGAVAFEERRPIHARELAEGVFQRLRWEIGVQTGECVAQAPLQHDVAVAGIAALGAGLAWGDVGAVEDGVTQCLEPGESSVLDDGLRKADGHHACPSRMQGSTSGVMIVVRTLARVTLTRKLYWRG